LKSEQKVWFVGSQGSAVRGRAGESPKNSLDGEVANQPIS